MEKFTQPTKLEVKAWLSQRHAEHKPLPDMEQIRRELGWGLGIDQAGEASRLSLQCDAYSKK